jgi:hypothetical protein
MLKQDRENKEVEKLTWRMARNDMKDKIHKCGATFD